MSMDRHTLQAVLEDQERHRDGVERRREERDAQRDAERSAHLTAMTDKMAAMCLAIQNLVVAQAQAQAQVPAAAAGPAQPTPKIRLQKMTSEDDPEAFLTTFERVATVSGWPARCWAAQLAPCLTGEAQAAYRALSNVAAEDYPQVKAAILQRLNITPETHCRRFRTYKRPEGTRPRIAAQQLWDHLTRWLRPTERTTQQIMESVGVDQFLEVLEPETRAWVARHSLETMDKAVELAEAFEDSLLRVDPSPAPAVPVKHRPLPAHPRTAARPSVFPVPLSASTPRWRPRLAPSWARENPWTPPPSGGPRDKQPSPTALPSPTCFRCHEVGHIARFCPAAMECDVALRCPDAEGEA
ncbi:zinc finger protein 444-like [Acipenser ruthenus]|uniref:zinc finger protein 444-like n=1 Tax=Acipenser ruthenus TaxID=7906 RepID=UPI002741D085|nr:zinc finger protein 444-like [Acipenser ruthenus]